MSNHLFLGTGVAFPITINQNGEIKKSSYEESIKESIYIILSTKYGERMMRPTFGCRIHELVFEPNNSATQNLAIYYVSEALKHWENRIELDEVTASEYESDSMIIDVKYRIRDTNSFYNLVYPFYLVEKM